MNCYCVPAMDDDNVNFMDLPPELVSLVLTHVPGKTLAQVPKVCQKLRAAADVELVWQARCSVEFGITRRQNTRPTYKELYQRVLYKYGRILGLWQLDMHPYGGLVHISFTGTGICATQFDPPKDPGVSDPLRPVKLFDIEIEESGDLQVMCHKGYQSAHQVIISTEKYPDSDDIRICVRCQETEKHRHPDSKQAEFTAWAANETNGNSVHNLNLFHGQELLLMKFILMNQIEHCFFLNPLPLPAPSADAMVKPGLFKGNYGAHGIELIMLAYDDDQQMIGMKVTGDPNVPMGEITIKADLRRPMILTQDQQTSIVTLSQIDTPDVPPDTDLAQPFIVPRDCLDRYQNEHPNRCKGRFHSVGQIAGHGFTRPSFTPGHWIVFDEDTFGHIWLELRSFSMYRRVKGNFLN